MMPDSRELSKLYSYIGFAKRSGALTVGCELTVSGIRGGKKTVLLALCASDASANTSKRITNCCAFYEATLLNISLTSEQLGKISGKGSPVSVVGVTDKSLASAIIKLNE